MEVGKKNKRNTDMVESRGLDEEAWTRRLPDTETQRRG